MGGTAATAEADRRAAFAHLVDRDLDVAYRIAAVILGSSQDAEDATHDAVVHAWRSFGALRDLARFEAWFHRILVNICRDRVRKRRRTPVTELRLAGERAAPSGFAGVDDRIALGRAFERLSPDQVVTVVLRFYADLTVEGVAIRTGVPVGTVKSRLHAAMAVLELALTGPEVIDL
jgi:RNA polymerase sigma-70 factor (ECF subfamily)